MNDITADITNASIFANSDSLGDKYELVYNDTITVKSHKLYRIRALRRVRANCEELTNAGFGDFVEAGDLGGYIESENNLSQYGTAWVYGNCSLLTDPNRRRCPIVYGNARIVGNAYIVGHVEVGGNALIKDKCRVTALDNVTDEGARCSTDTVIDEDAILTRYVKVISGGTHIHGKAILTDRCVIGANSSISEYAFITNNVSICESTIKSVVVGISGILHDLYLTETFREGITEAYEDDNEDDDIRKFNLKLIAEYVAARCAYITERGSIADVISSATKIGLPVLVGNTAIFSHDNDDDLYYYDTRIIE
jgi:carbonic anhydrase/acetyltransferase-like protein (isoleucine patch superfamily)